MWIQLKHEFSYGRVQRTQCAARFPALPLTPLKFFPTDGLLWRDFPASLEPNRHLYHGLPGKLAASGTLHARGCEGSEILDFVSLLRGGGGRACALRFPWEV